MIATARSYVRSYLKFFIYPILLITVLLLTYLPAMRSPTPNDIQIGMAGPAEMVTPLAEAFEQGAAGAYEVVILPDAATARAAVEERDLSAVLVLTASGEDRAAGDPYWNSTTLPEPMQESAGVIYIAAAASPVLATAGMVPLQSLAAQMGLPVMVRDLVPLDDNDLAGNGQMWFTLAVTMAGYVGVTMLGSIAPDLLRFRTLIKALPVYGLVMGVITSLVLGFVFDSLSMKLLPLVITSVLNVTAVGLGAALITRIVGGLATLVVMFVFMGIGLTSSGAAIPHQMVPAFYRFFNPIMPYGATSRSVRDIMYFDNAGLWQNWLVLAAWIVAMSAGLLLLNRWKPEPEPGPTVVSERGVSAVPVAA